MAKKNTLRLAPEFMLCRDLMHPWQPNTARRIENGFERTLMCARCGAIKTQLLTKTGIIRRTRTSYPKGYLLPAGTGPLSRDQRAALRVTNIKEF